MEKNETSAKKKSKGVGKKKKKAGGQTKYKTFFADSMLDYFKEYGENGEKGIPLMEAFAGSIGVTARTLQNWAEKYQKFGEAYERCMDIQEAKLINGGLTGTFVPKMASLLLNARHKVVEHRAVVLEKENENGEIVPVKIEDL